VLLGGVGAFRNAEHFLDLRAASSALSGPRSPPGLTGCVRRLEINDRAYAFYPAERGGDALYGVDIGEEELRRSIFSVKSNIDSPSDGSLLLGGSDYVRTSRQP